MKLIAITLLAFLSAAPAAPQATRGIRPVAQTTALEKLRTGKAYALIIATDNYRDPGWPHLQNPVNDARTLAAELKQNYGYEEPDVLFDATLQQVEAKLASYLDRQFGPGDSLLIFVAGHGKFDDRIKEGYLVFSNSRHDDPLSDTYLPHSKLRKVVDSMQCNRILLLIDACFGGTFDDQVATRGDEIAYPEATKAELVLRKSTLKTRLFLSSGGKEYVPDGTPGHNSPFAREVLTVLRTYGGNSGLLTFSDLYRQVERLKDTQPQYGWFGSSAAGADFWFATASANATIARVAAPAPPDAAPTRGAPAAAPVSFPPLTPNLTPQERNKILNEAYAGGLSALTQRQYDTAIDWFRKAVAANDGQPAVWWKLGVAYAGAAFKDNSLYPSAFAAFDKAIAIKGDDPQFYTDYAMTLAAGGRFSDAEGKARKANQLDPPKAAARFYDLGASVLNHGGNSDDAIRAFKDATGADPNNADAWFQYGSLLARKASKDATGKLVAPPGAADALQKYLELASAGPYAVQAKSLLQTLQ